MSPPLAAGTPMPPLAAIDLDAKPVDITASVAGHWAAILLFRGHW